MTKSIKLVVDFEKGLTKEYFQPEHIKGSVALDGLTLGRRLEEKGHGIESSDIKAVAEFVAKNLYAGQFTAEELIDGIHASKVTTKLMEELSSILGTESGNASRAKKS